MPLPVYRHSPKYIMVRLRKIQHSSELSIRVVNYVCMCVFMFVCLFVRMCVFVLLPSSNFPPCSTHCALFPANESLVHVHRILLFLNWVNLKSHNVKLLKFRNVCILGYLNFVNLLLFHTKKNKVMNYICLHHLGHMVIYSQSVIQWPMQAGIFHARAETNPVSEIICFVRSTKWWTESRNDIMVNIREATVSLYNVWPRRSAPEWRATCNPPVILTT